MTDTIEKGSKWWIRYVFVPILVAIIGGGGICAVVVALIPNFSFPSSATQTINTPEVVQPTSTVSIKPENTNQSAQCDWLKNNLPQSADEVLREFDLPPGTTILLIYELCPTTANAFSFKTNPTTVIELQVPEGGCIDSWSGFTEYVGDVGTPIDDGNGGWRVYKGVVRAPEMTYRISECK